MEKLTEGATEVAIFPANSGRRQSRVSVYELKK
jgi:hypothetical protein